MLAGAATGAGPGRHGIWTPSLVTTNRWPTVPPEQAAGDDDGVDDDGDADADADVAGGVGYAKLAIVQVADSGMIRHTMLRLGAANSVSVSAPAGGFAAVAGIVGLLTPSSSAAVPDDPGDWLD